LLQAAERFQVEGHIPVDDLVALHADQVRVRLGTVAIVMVVVA
jgi:hypothetical protein